MIRPASSITVAAVVLAAVVGSVSCSAGVLREPKRVKRSKIERQCGAVTPGGLSREQALCVAGLAGLRTAAGEATIRASRSLKDEETWVVDEICGAANPECIGVVLRRSDGKRLATRFLYVTRLRSAQRAARRPPPPREDGVEDLSRYFGGTDEGCFILQDLRGGVSVRHNPERCAKRFPPCSTFKIPNAMIGLETGAIPDADHVIAWDGQHRSRRVTNRDHTLASAVKHSVVWYFQELARRVGEESMQRQVSAIPYGNEDISGGLTRFWLGSTLAISAEEQVDFLRRLERGELPFSSRTTGIVREILVLDRREETVLRGKTGSCRGAESDLGWFVGSLSAPDGAWVFACNISGRGAWGTDARRICESILQDRGLWPPPPGASGLP